MVNLGKGGNAPLTTRSVVAVLSWREQGAAHDIDLCALLVGGDGKVRDDTDFVFFNQPTHPSGSVVHLGRDGTSERLRVDIASLPDDVQKVVVVASISGGTFGDVDGLVLSVRDRPTDDEEHQFSDIGAQTETALVVGELYLRQGAWKFRAVGQGWDSGLAGLATDFGVAIGDPSPPVAEPVVEPVAAPVAPVDPAPAASVPLEPAPEHWVEPPVPAASAVLDRTEHQRPLPVAARRRVVSALAPSDAVDLDAAPLTLASGQSITLVRGGVPITGQIWLRVSHEADAPVRGIDLSLLSYDVHGELVEIVHVGAPGGTSGTLRLLPRPVSALLDDTAAVDLRLEEMSSGCAALVLTVSVSTGAPLEPSGTLLTDLITADGSVLVRAVCTAPQTSAAVLVTITRSDRGEWTVADVADPAAGRSALGLVGAGHWTLSG